MRPTRHDLSFQAGDTVDLLFKLWTVVDGARVPFVPDVGEAFELAVRWLGGQIVASTEDTSDARLVLTQSAGVTSLYRQLTAAETAQVPNSRQVEFTLARLPEPDERRTWLTGSVAGQRSPKPSTGDTALSLIIEDGGITVEVTVDDAAAENIIAAARAAVEARLDAFAAAVSVMEVPGAAAIAIAAGQALAVDKGGSGLVLASSSSFPLSSVAGFSAQAVDAGYPAKARRDRVALNDWTPIAGAAALLPGRDYFLAPTPGCISLLPDTAPGHCTVRVGFAVSATLLAVEISPPFLN